MEEQLVNTEEQLANERITKQEAPEDYGEGGCVCQYIPEDLRDAIWRVAEHHEAFTGSIVVAALRVGIAVLEAKTVPFYDASGGHGEIPQRKGRRKSKLAGAGV